MVDIVVIISDVGGLDVLTLFCTVIGRLAWQHADFDIFFVKYVELCTNHRFVGSGMYETVGYSVGAGKGGDFLAVDENRTW